MKPLAFATYTGSSALTADDALAVAPLGERGIEAVPAAWNDPAVRWEKFAGVVIRSCWDYHLMPAEFRRWVNALNAAEVMVWNPAGMLLWNMDKRYLLDLAAKGVQIPRTIWVEAGATPDLSELLHDAGIHQAVVKPAISATAHQTWRVARERAADFQKPFEKQVLSGATLVQEFIPELLRDGEWSLLFFGGQFSHAVKKRPAGGDFRVQHDYGGSAVPEAASAALLSQARQILATLDTMPLYARVDGVEVAGQLVLLELELIEPELFLRLDPAAPERFAAAVARACGKW
ncbi:MAG: hypothetical protein KDI38_19495 [Calditrichaeota bacterium]|nr:hypothetical protein [Calditrichota bacterium]